ncbi:MAG: hypothetical protein ACREH5_03490, partial [Candidatus Omnitrophota bacterium]
MYSPFFSPSFFGVFARGKVSCQIALCQSKISLYHRVFSEIKALDGRSGQNQKNFAPTDGKKRGFHHNFAYFWIHPIGRDTGISGETSERKGPNMQHSKALTLVA